MVSITTQPRRQNFECMKAMKNEGHAKTKRGIVLQSPADVSLGRYMGHKKAKPKVGFTAQLSKAEKTAVPSNAPRL